MSAEAPLQTQAPYKPYAFALLWLALIAQAVWMFLNHFSLHQPWSSMTYPLTYAAPFLFLAVTTDAPVGSPHCCDFRSQQPFSTP